MKGMILLGLALFLLNCSGASKADRAREHQEYHNKRIDCEQTKNTSENANITQCTTIRPDAK
ncbi:MAG: hypothetical protein RIG61_07275 [Deltaproteobacteria bacterium]